MFLECMKIYVLIKHSFFCTYFSDLNMNRLNPTGEVVELSGLVGKMLAVFQDVYMYVPRLKERWANTALQVS